jgi:NAD(P)-dependent dehydrogenase (short-subunit alcohol dehydrogenase family)
MNEGSDLSSNPVGEGIIKDDHVVDEQTHGNNKESKEEHLESTIKNLSLSQEESVLQESQESTGSGGRLHWAKKCHICHANFKFPHHFYDQLCQECADFNFIKRTQHVPMDGKVAIVTGARVKIGFCIALKLLRCGAFVLAATRFPKDAIRRYRKEPDFHEWRHRLRVYGLDFRDIPMVHHFCDHIKRTYSRLDMIINNAAQTVRRPPIFYQHLLEEEMKPLEDDLCFALVDYIHYTPRDAFILNTPSTAINNALESSNQAVVPVHENTSKPTLCTSAILSQVPLIQGDSEQRLDLFPPGLYDIDDQQVDLRTQNSWTMRIGEVSTVEVIECHAINAFAPWVLNSELRPLLADTSMGDEWKKDGRYIVNVSAMEGGINTVSQIVFIGFTQQRFII